MNEKEVMNNIETEENGNIEVSDSLGTAIGVAIGAVGTLAIIYGVKAAKKLWGKHKNETIKKDDEFVDAESFEEVSNEDQEK